MTRFWTFFAVFERFWIKLKRYAFNTLSGLVTLYLIFLLIFAGAKYAQGFGINLFGESLEGLVVGFLVWTFALSAYSDLSWSIMREAQQGTLEQLYMCPFGFRFVSFAWIVSSFLTTFVFSGTLLFLMMVTTGKYLRLPLGTLLPLAFLTVAPSMASASSWPAWPWCSSEFRRFSKFSNSCSCFSSSSLRIVGGRKPSPFRWERGSSEKP